ncbi:MAG: hypothetical protein LN588_05730 [Rickettsia endosymbiont of Bryobia graminum]|nr:hypothetical protein [Rickettsia endosymbiont of Bryobia graminum]
MLNNPYYSLTWSVLGVLSIARLITVTSYEHYYNEILFTNINAPQDRFLSEAAYYLEHHNISHYRPTIKIVGE